MSYTQASLTNTTDELMSKSAELTDKLNVVKKDIKKLENNISEVDAYHREKVCTLRKITKEDISTLQARVTMLEKLLLISNICSAIAIIGILILINL